MASQPAFSSPSVVQEGVLDRATSRSFLADVIVEHGPRDVLGRFFLKADTALRQRGIRLSFSDCDELKAVNHLNIDSWSPILPIFDPAVSDVGDKNCLVIVGRNSSGDVVFAHAARHYQLSDRSLKEEIESLRLFYRDPRSAALPDEAMLCSAPIAAKMRDGLLFSGALWLRPDCRGRDIRDLTGPIIRSLSYTRWKPDYIFSFMVPKLVELGLAKRVNMHVDFEVTMINTPVKRGGTINAGLVWIPRSEQESLFAGYLDSLSERYPQIDGRVVEGATDKKLVG